LWPSSHRVLAELVKLGYSTIVAQDGLVTPLVSKSVEDAGGTVRLVSEFIQQERGVAAIEASKQMNEAVRDLLEGADAAGPDDVGRVLAEAVQASTLQMIGLIEGLNAALRLCSIRAAVFSETDIQFSRLAARIMRRNGISTFLVAHGTLLGSDYTVSGDVLTDVVFTFGPSAARRLAERGLHPGRIHVTGNPAWDHYPHFLDQRKAVREHVCRECAFDESRPLLMFGTTWMTHIMRFQEDDLFEATTRAFLRAVRILRERGVAFNCIIKDRASNAKFGKDLIARFAHEERVTDYRYAAGLAEQGIVSADILVAYDSNLFVEAMFAGLPAINMWSPSSWTMGPCFDARDGMPFVARDEPERLADAIQLLLTDPGARADVVNKMRARLPEYHREFDGRAAHRCAAIVDAYVRGAPLPPDAS